MDIASITLKKPFPDQIKAEIACEIHEAFKLSRVVTDGGDVMSGGYLRATLENSAITISADVTVAAIFNGIDFEDDPDVQGYVKSQTLRALAGMVKTRKFDLTEYLYPEDIIAIIQHDAAGSLKRFMPPREAHEVSKQLATILSQKGIFKSEGMRL